MVTIEDMQQMLDAVAEEFPPEFFAELNGGIILLPEVKLHEKSRDDDYFILGEYNTGGGMGRYIALYYGSFMRVFPGADNTRLMEELRRTVRHEFRHHLESLAGVADLELVDEENLSAYLRRPRRLKVRVKKDGTQENKGTHAKET